MDELGKKKKERKSQLLIPLLIGVLAVLTLGLGGGLAAAISIGVSDTDDDTTTTVVVISDTVESSVSLNIGNTSTSLRATTLTTPNTESVNTVQASSSNVEVTSEDPIVSSEPSSPSQSTEIQEQTTGKTMQDLGTSTKESSTITSEMAKTSKNVPTSSSVKTTSSELETTVNKESTTNVNVKSSSTATTEGSSTNTEPVTSESTATKITTTGTTISSENTTPENTEETSKDTTNQTTETTTKLTTKDTTQSTTQETTKPTTKGTTTPTSTTIADEGVFPKNCGTSGRTSRIVNGQIVTDNSIPFIVSLNIKTSAGEQLCGGSIVNSNWIVTAAHCFEGMSDAEVKNSEVVISDLDLVEVDTGEKKIKIEQGFEHPDYESSDTNLYNDIYLIKIGEAITFNDKAQPICISDDRPSEGEEVTAAGWGRIDVPAEGEISEKLRKVTFPIQADSVCELEAKETAVSFCAGNPDEEKDSCKGDSGGPLYKFENGIFTLTGVTSYGVDNTCGGKGIYATVSVFKAWMKETMENNQ
ncbi:hypothetical protein SNEBB_008073 [Seison nebaliae]|nr:hypothetical protein SNEBB_008073 [Seison nebaliae]